MLTLGQCRDCFRRRLVGSVGHMGGGGYRRSHHWYSSSICASCAATNIRYRVARWDQQGCKRVLSESIRVGA